MKKEYYTAREKKKLKKMFSGLRQPDLLEVAVQLGVSYSHVRVVKSMHSTSSRVIQALVAKVEDKKSSPR